MGYLNERHGMFLMPTKPGVCSKCGIDHPEDQPHNRDTLLYQYTFYDEYGRWPSWADAMAHCSEAVKAVWTRELTNHGIEVGEFPETGSVGLTIEEGE